MWHALTWILVVSLLLAWSLAAWVFHAVASWAASRSGDLAGSTESILAVSMPDWLKPWVPEGWWGAAMGMMTDLAPVLDGLLSALPSLSGPLALLVWVAWAVGAFLIVVAGVVASGLLVHLTRKHPDRLPALLNRRTDPSVR